MPVERIAPEQLESILRAQHVAHIDEDTQRILAARACGCPVEQIAECLHRAPSSVSVLLAGSRSRSSTRMA
jgi:DNA-binding NarL/FixJ family response regulator